MDRDPQFISLVPEGSPHQVIGERVVMLPGLTLEILTTRRIELDSWVLKGEQSPEQDFAALVEDIRKFHKLDHEQGS